MRFDAQTWREMEKQARNSGWDFAALTREQVTKYKLPTRPTKVEGNTHAGKFSDVESVELDAMDPTILAELLRTAIERHIDGQALEVMLEAERSERTILARLARDSWTLS